MAHPPVRLSGEQALAVAKGFGGNLRQNGVACYACAILPDHAHLVIGRTEKSITALGIALKGASVHALLECGLHPYQHVAEKRPKVWARGSRHPFLYVEEEIERTISYVERNPIKAGFKSQRWSFVTPYPPPHCKK